MKRILSLAMATLMLLALLSACKSTSPSASTPAGGGGTSTPPAGESQTPAAPTGIKAGEGGDLLIALASSPETIDPTMGSAVDSANYHVHHYEGLLRYKWDGTGVEPGAAESWDISDDGMVWTFHLRDTKWSDGQPVTAADFEYSWKRLADPATAAPYSYDMACYVKNGIAILDGEMGVDELGVKVVDEKTFEVTLQNPCPYFGEIAAFPVFMPLRKDMIDQYGEDWVKKPESYISNGPFKMQSFALDEKMVSVPNENYWDAASVLPSSITWLFLSDDKAELAALRTGEAHYIDGFPQEETAALKAEGQHGLIPQLGTYYISFNVANAPLDNALVRKALTLAIDTDFIATVLREGTVTAAEAFVGTGFATASYDKPFRSDWKTYVAPAEYEANKELAKQALADAGYPNGEGIPKIEYLLNDNSGHIMIAEALQSMWKEVLGVNIEIRVADWATVTADRRAGNFHIARNGWIGDYNDPATMLTLFLSTSGNNDGNYNNPAYDAKIAESNAETDPAKRNTLLHEAEDILIGEDWACSPIYYYSDEWAVVKELKNWGITPLGYKFFAGSYLEK